VIPRRVKRFPYNRPVIGTRVPEASVGRRRRAARLALALWFVLAFVVWHVVFDRVLVLEGRRFVYDAALAADLGRPFLLIEPRMASARRVAFQSASWTAMAILSVGGLAIAVAVRRDAARRNPRSNPLSRRAEVVRASD